MPSTTKTLAAIDKYLEDNQEDGMRAHLGASIIGRKCSRELFYTFRWATKKKHRAQLLRLFKRGHEEEDRFIKYLRDAGIKVWAADKDGEQFKISDCGGHFGGSLDGICKHLPDLPMTPLVTEFKTHGDKSFKHLIVHKVKKSKYQHYVQMQIYMYKMKLEWALYMAVNKNDDHLYLEIVRLDPAVAIAHIEKAKRIIFTEVAPDRVSYKKDSYDCMFCDHSDICHGTKTPAINCRTCAYVTPEKDGTWSCSNKNYTFLKNTMKQAYICHIFHPTLLNKVEVLEFNEKENWMLLQIGDKKVKHGSGGVSSKDLVLG